MGRHRIIDRDAVLDAAQKVVSRDGAARLTLEAVAVEAGISKASVLYDYKTKQALTKAMIERRVLIENARMQSFIDAMGPIPDAPIRGRLAATSRAVSDDDRAAAISLCAALAQDVDLQRPIRASYAERIAEIQRTSIQPRSAMLAFLAVEGLMLMEWLGLHSWSEPERDRLVADLEWLIGQSPAGPGDTPAAA